MVATALFDINEDGDNGGFLATPGQVLTLRLRPPLDSAVNHVLFQVYDPNGFDPDVGIAGNPPLASKDAPLLTLVGATSGQKVSPTTVGGNVTVTMPGTGGHSYIVRCVVNGGVRALSNGDVIADPRLVFQRGVFLLTSYGTRKIVGTELFEFSPGGWADAVNDLILLGGAPLATFQPGGAGAQVRTIDGYLNEGISVHSFLTDAQRTAVINGTFAHDNRAALQAAIDYAIYRSTSGSHGPGPRLHLGPGQYRSDGPLHVGYGHTFVSITIEGEGWKYGGGGGTLIKFQNTDNYGIAVQGGRNVHLKDFSIEGANYEHAVSVVQNMATHGLAALDQALWIDAGLSNERYRPYVGIAIDPRSGPKPAQAYPDISYPGYLGALPQYGKEGSSNTKLENIGIYGFVGGIGQQTCDYDGNGDYTKLDRVYAHFCAWGMSWGNSQSRVMHWNDVTFVGVHTGFHTSVHGRQQGKPTVLASSCEFSTIMYLMDISLAFGEGPHFDACFSEGMYSLGRVTGARTTGGLKFTSCEWGFSYWLELGVPAAVFEHMGVGGLVAFENCFFFNPIPYGTFHFRAQGSYEVAELFAFDGCWGYLREASADTEGTPQLWAKSAFGATLGLTFSFGSTRLERYSWSSGDTRDLTTGDLIGPTMFGTENAGPRNRPLNAYTKRARSLLTGNDPGVAVARRVFGSVTINGGIVSQVGRDVEFVFTGVGLGYLMMVGGDVGDVLICDRTNAVFWVRKRVGDHLHIRAQTGFGPSGALLSALIPGDFFWSVNCRHYMPNAVLYGDITSGSPTITNVRLGSGGFPADIGAHIAQFDYLFVDNEVDKIMEQEEASVQAFDNGAHTITMFGNFIQTRTHMRLGPFVRQPVPNAP